MSEARSDFFRRKEELLVKLEERARACPGLYPVRTREEFLRLAMDQAGEGDAWICQILEGMWRRPDEVLQIHAQSLIQRGLGWGNEKVGDGKPDQATR